MRKLDGMMDCVKKAFLEGCERGDEFHKMRHAITVELKRLGYEASEIKDMLLEWNARCERPLSLSEQKIQLFGYVEWVFKRECKIGCRACQDYCLGKENCQYYIKKYLAYHNPTKDLPFDFNELKKFLEERYKRDWFMMHMILDAILWFKHKHAIGPLIYISYAKIASIIRDRYKKRPDNKDIARKIKFLIEEGIIERKVKGQRGMFSRKANGYMFLPWKHPKDNREGLLRVDNSNTEPSDPAAPASVVKEAEQYLSSSQE